MIQFFQTRVGDKFFNSTLPRLVKALETLAGQQDSSSELENRVAKLEILLELANIVVPKEILCSDGYSVMLVHRSSSSNGGTCGLAFPSSIESLLEPYRANPNNEEAVAYEQVPERLLAQVILNHGGLPDAELVY